VQAVSQIGQSVIDALAYVGELASLSARAAGFTFLAPFRGKSMRLGRAFSQAMDVGVRALPILSLITFFIGLILALQSAYELRKFGAINFVASAVAISMTRELGPLITAIVIAGRSGSAFAAEIGTMKVAEEIDALEAMGLNSVKYLVVPKYLAMLVMMPCLTLISDLAGILGGGLFEIWQLDQSYFTFLFATRDALVMRDIWTGLIKSLIFALIITKVGCYEGFSVQGGAEGVGKATTSSVVVSIFLIIFADVVFTALFYYTA